MAFSLLCNNLSWLHIFDVYPSSAFSGSFTCSHLAAAGELRLDLDLHV